MRVLAILAIHNERPYLSNCLAHLIENGIDFAIVDNGSTDGSAELLRELRFVRHLRGYSQVPFNGVFVWRDILLAQERLVRSIDADWILLVAPDEILHSNDPGETLAHAIGSVAERGYNVINFDEFVFLPIDGEYIPDCPAAQPLRHYYYYFAPGSGPRSMRAWRKDLNLTNIRFGGHKLTGKNIRLCPENFVQRHYMFRSQAHALQKYAQRVFDPEEVGIGWHRNRVGRAVDSFVFPALDCLESLASPSDRNLSREHPRPNHYWDWPLRARSNRS